ncbi:MAG: agmatine deiminase family protein [Pirellulales bacterium]|nr:agmatine deiminase family protein [Pirellulales bacterium]
MAPDWETNMVYFSGLLGRRYPGLCKRVVGVLENHAVPVRFLEATADIWIRDYAPVQVAESRFVKFRYSPDYLQGCEQLITKDEICGQLEALGEIVFSDLVVDGGNVVAAGSRVFLTEKVLRENRTLGQAEVERRLRDAFCGRTCVFVPTEPRDPIGHSDGLVRPLDDDRVVVNDYCQVDPRYARRLERVLAEHGLEIHRLPYLPDTKSRRKIPPATGNYVNFLRVGKLVIVPAHGLPEDTEAVQVLQRLLPAATVVSLDCKELAREGGCWNCVSWTIIHPAA